MEVAATYGPTTVRPRLTVVKDGHGGYSALPHAVLFDKRLSSTDVRLYAAMQAHWRQDGECFASHITLAEEIGVTVRQIRRCLNKLMKALHVVERPSGGRRSKAYSPAPIGHQGPIGEPSNETSGSDRRRSNRTFLSRQSDILVQGNRTSVSDSKKKKPVKKKPEEEPLPPGEVIAAGAAPAPKQTGEVKPTKAPRPPSETPSGRLIDLVKAGGAPLTMRPQDHRALKDSGADPAVVAEAYCAIFHGQWGDDFMRRALSVQFVIGRLAGFQAWKNRQAGVQRPSPTTPRPRSSASRMRTVEI